MNTQALLKRTGNLWIGNFEIELPMSPFTSGFQSGVQNLLNDNPFNANTENQEWLEFEKGFKLGLRMVQSENSRR